MSSVVIIYYAASAAFTVFCKSGHKGKEKKALPQIYLANYAKNPHISFSLTSNHVFHARA
jgi:hypothetical protein